jgi:hypothetical protein
VPFRPGLLTPSDAQALAVYHGLARANARELADRKARRPWRDRFPARVDSYDSGTQRYSWTEQTFDATGSRIDKPGGRTGSTTYSPAYAFGDGSVVTDFPHPTTLTRRLVAGSLGPVYEFPLYCACVGGGSGGSVLVPCCDNTLPRTLTLTISAAGTCLDGKTVTLAYISGTSNWGGSLTFDCSGHTVALVFFLHCETGGGILTPTFHLVYGNSGECGIAPFGFFQGTCIARPFGLDIFNYYTCNPFAATWTQERSGPTTLTFANVTGGAYVCGGDGNPVTLTVTE